MCPGTCAEVDLPGRPSGNADELRAGASAWDHLAWEIWQLSRPLEAGVDVLMAGWSGAAADSFAAAWQPVRRAFFELDPRIHDVAHRLRDAADSIEEGQTAYPLDIAASAALGAAESVGGGRAGGLEQAETGQGTGVVTDVLRSLPVGRSPGVWTVGSEEQLRETFDFLTRGGTSATWKGYGGPVYEVRGGTQIGLRTVSRSGGPTIDIRTRSGDQWKIHIR